MTLAEVRWSGLFIGGFFLIVAGCLACLAYGLFTSEYPPNDIMAAFFVLLAVYLILAGVVYIDGFRSGEAGL